MMKTVKSHAEKPKDASDITSLAEARKELAALRALFGNMTVKIAPEVKNAAFVFIKPHAVNTKVKNLVRSMLKKAGLSIGREGAISSKDIDSKRLIDNHYYAIASKATLMKPKDLPVPPEKFLKQFGKEWADALAEGSVYNALDAAAYLGLNAKDLEAEWRKCKPAKKLVKFGGGFYCGLIDTVAGKKPIYVFNAFFMSMREKFTAADGAGIHYFSVSWDPKKLNWAAFRGQLLGPTDPAAAPASSIRGTIMSDWKQLGLASAPNTGDNGVHASASPFEGLAERMNWLQNTIESDPFGPALLQAGLTKACIKAWSVDPQVLVGPGKQGSIFDALEDLDCTNCLKECKRIFKAS